MATPGGLTASSGFISIYSSTLIFSFGLKFTLSPLRRKLAYHQVSKKEYQQNKTPQMGIIKKGDSG
jgi:hypothetical protein